MVFLFRCELPSGQIDGRIAWKNEGSGTTALKDYMAEVAVVVAGDAVLPHPCLKATRFVPTLVRESDVQVCYFHKAHTAAVVYPTDAGYQIILSELPK